MYEPNPINVDDVVLSEEVACLAELLAKNVHEVWVKTRIEQGWTYGEHRDDILKEHPCLVPYEVLSEEEKVLDRNTMLCTLKLVEKLGFKITAI